MQKRETNIRLKAQNNRQVNLLSRNCFVLCTLKSQNNQKVNLLSGNLHSMYCFVLSVRSKQPTSCFRETYTLCFVLCALSARVDKSSLKILPHNLENIATQFGKYCHTIWKHCHTIWSQNIFKYFSSLEKLPQICYKIQLLAAQLQPCFVRIEEQN